MQKFDRGDPKCEFGLVFEVANLVGMKLFSDEKYLNRYSNNRHIDDKFALLPKRIRRIVKVDDDS